MIHIENFSIDIIDEIKSSNEEVLLKTSYLNDNLIELISERSNMRIILNSDIIEKKYKDIKELISKGKKISKENFDGYIYVYFKDKSIEFNTKNLIFKVNQGGNISNEFIPDEYIDLEQLTKIHKNCLEQNLYDIFDMIRKEIKVLDYEIKYVRFYKSDISIKKIVEDAGKNIEENPSKLCFSVFNYENENVNKGKYYNKIYENLEKKCKNIEEERERKNTEYTVKIGKFNMIKKEDYIRYVNEINKYIELQKKDINKEELNELLEYRRVKVRDAIKEELKNREIEYEKYKNKIDKLIDSKIPDAQIILDKIELKTSIKLDLSNEVMINMDSTELVKHLSVNEDEKKQIVEEVEMLKYELKNI